MLYLINKSINKWYKILNGGEDLGKINCPLCKKFYYNLCIDCPIKKYSKLSYCKGTPYEKWINHQKSYHDNNIFRVSCDICNDIAKDEIEFLLMIKEVIKNVYIS